jgi:hypothetical protein
MNTTRINNVRNRLREQDRLERKYGVPLGRRLRRIPLDLLGELFPEPLSRQSVGRKNPLHEGTGDTEAERKLFAVRREIKRVKRCMNGSQSEEQEIELEMLRDMRDDLIAAVVVIQAKREQNHND